MNYAVVILILVAITGFLWLLDILLRRVFLRGREFPGAWRWLADTGRGFFPLLLAVFLLRSFVVEPFHIPSGSLMPTVLVGDFVATEKYAYGLYIPILHKKFISTGSPHRGDIFVFHFPVDSALKHCQGDPLCAASGEANLFRTYAGVDFIKRVIGLPGDTIGYTCDNQLVINGRKVRREYLGIYHGEGSEAQFTGEQVWREYLPQPDGSIVRHRILLMPDRPIGPPYCGRTWTVAPNSYFAMGDNRDDSDDSRAWGDVPEANLVGRARLVFF
ncbi:MAG TPA: signal peptidase I, partial [Gammaproteobacteria bacterium]|nr:signal peptidase I [Gammaproteobacteria bacterium]